MLSARRMLTDMLLMRILFDVIEFLNTALEDNAQLINSIMNSKFKGVCIFDMINRFFGLDSSGQHYIIAIKDEASGTITKFEIKKE